MVHNTTSLVQPGELQLPEIALPLSELQMKTAYFLLRTLRTSFCCPNPSVFDTTAALVQLPPVGDSRSPYQVPPPESTWPIPQLPLNAMSLHGNLSGEESDYAQDDYVYHLVNAATAFANTAGRNVGQFRA